MQLEWVFKYVVYARLSAHELTSLRIIHAQSKLLMANDEAENDVMWTKETGTVRMNIT